MTPTKTELKRLLRNLQREIEDNFRAHDDSTEPSMLVTIGTFTCGNWVYQTGNRSFAGPCDGCDAEAAVALHRDSDCAELAGEIIAELEEHDDL